MLWGRALTRGRAEGGTSNDLVGSCSGAGCMGSTSVSSSAQMTDASSRWWQSVMPNGAAGHCSNADSFPQHRTLSSQMGPVPSPKNAPPGATSASPQPSCLQTTVASGSPQPSSQTVPQRPVCSSSTRPAQRPGPPTRRSGYGAEE